MAKEIKDNCVSTYITKEEKELFNEVAEIISTSKAEFVRGVLMKEVRKVLKQNKKGK